MEDINKDVLEFHPKAMQFVVNEYPCILLLGIGVFCRGIEGFPFIKLLEAGCLLLILYLIYQWIFLLRSRFIVTDEQLIHRYGVFTRQADYIELYRVVDFKEHSSFLQQLAGLKTVIVYSGDRTHTCLKIPGLEQNFRLVDYIRERVERNKRRKGIYEITNR